MRVAVVCFSNTGNTKRIAESICTGIKSVTEECELLSLRKAKRGLTISASSSIDLLGIGCPTYFLKEPYVVTRFIRRSVGLQGKPVFVFCTSGGHPGNTLPSMARELSLKGAAVIGGFNCDAGACTPPSYPYPFYSDGHPDEVDLADAVSFGRQVVEKLTSMKYVVSEPIPGNTMLGIEDPEYYPRGAAGPMTKDFPLDMSLNEKKCRYPECRLCVEACPMGAINLETDPIRFRKGCISCYFCEVICPYGAIEFDAVSLKKQVQNTRERTMRNRYAEFFEMAKTTFVGNRTTLFRDLVGGIDISKWDRVRYQAYDKRPRTTSRHMM